jgi:hypothetical protein
MALKNLDNKYQPPGNSLPSIQNILTVERMEKAIFITDFNNKIGNNFERLRPYYEQKFNQLTELTTLKFEILNCLMLGFHQASICTTNHFLERALKLSLIHLYTLGLTFFDKDYNQKTQEAHNKYDRKLALDNQLITNDEFATLTKIKGRFRDSYSHAEMEAILGDIPKFVPTRAYSFDSVKTSLRNNTPLVEPIHLKHLTIQPSLAQHLQEIKSKALAQSYFNDVYNILMEIDKRLATMKIKKD